MPTQATDLRNALYGVELFDPEKHSELSQELVCHLQFQNSPTTYILGITLEEFSGQKLQRGDKIAWKAFLVFNESLWYIHDWKNSSWTLKGPPDSDSVRDRFLKKLRQAARTIEQRLDSQARTKIQVGDFAIANQFTRLNSYYLHLRRDAEELLTLSMGKQQLELISSGTTPGGGRIQCFKDVAMDNYFAKLGQSDAAAASAVILFFGLMEVLFDACFAFGDRKGLTYFEFRSKEWKERFKLVVDVRLQPAERLYRELLHVQKKFRNVFTHALPTLFVLNEELGWIPAKTNELTNPRMNWLYAFDREEVQTTFTLFDEVMSFFESYDATWAAAMYAKTPLVIPLAPERIAELKSHTGSRDAFEREIDRRIEFHDAFINGGI